MYAIYSFVFVVFIAIAQLASAATPPACLIAALEAQPNPSDLTALCGSLESSMVSNITSACASGIESAAFSVYSATCLAQGVTIRLPTSTSFTASATSTREATTTSIASGTHTTGTSSVGANTATATTSSATSTATNAGNIESPRFGGMFAALLAVGGIAVGLL